MDDSSGTAAQRTARAVTDLVGDGCVVRAVDPQGGALRVVAVDHRDRERREALKVLLGRTHAPSEGWVGQSLEKNLAFRVQNDAAADAAAGGVHDPAVLGCVHGGVVTPLRVQGRLAGVVVALRDSVAHPYTLREQRLVERLSRGEALVGATTPADEGHVAERVLEHAAAGVWVTGLDGVTTYVNEAVTRLVGAPASWLVGMPMTSFIDEQPQMVRSNIGPQVERQDHRLRRPDGAEAWVSVMSTPLTDTRGRRCGTVSTLTEISARKRMEVELRLRASAHESVAELAQRALAGEEPERLMRGAVEMIADALGAEYTSVCEVLPGWRELVPRAAIGWDQALLGRRMRLPSHSPGRLALDDDEPVAVDDFAAMETLDPGALPRQADIRSAVCVGIGGGVGFMTAHSPRPGAFAGQDLGFLRLLAGVLAGRWQPTVPGLAVVSA